MAKRYLLKQYVKYFFLILFALVLFFVGLDFLQALKSLPKSANLQVLYLLFRTFHGIDVLFPVSIVFAMIALKVHLIRSNELVAFYALGYSKRDMIKPLFITAVFLTFIYLLLHLTSFTYADEYAKNIRKFHSLSNSTRELFFKYNNSYVYFDQLFPLQKMAKKVRIFEVNGTKVVRIVKASNAYFENDHWRIENALVIRNEGDKISTSVATLRSLYGYRPKILDSVYEGKTNISLLDALYALRLLKQQHLGSQKIKAIVFAHLFYPLFAPFFMIIVFYFVPISARLTSVNLFSLGAIVSTLIVWGLLYTLVKLSFTGVLAPEYTILLPIALLSVIAFYLYKKF